MGPPKALRGFKRIPHIKVLHKLSIKTHIAGRIMGAFSGFY